MSDFRDLIVQASGAEKAGVGAEAITAQNTPEGDLSTEDDSIAVASPYASKESHTVNTSDPDERSGEDTEEGDAASETKPDGDGDKEVISVTDNKGKRQITVDYKDRARIKKAHELAAGARKWQAERDAATKKAAEVEKNYEGLRKRFDILEKAWEQDGEDGLIKALSGGKRSVDDIYRERAEREARRLAADPAELARMDAEESKAAQLKEYEKLQREFEALKTRVEGDKQVAEVKAKEATVYPAFDKYRFEGSLGNESQELMLDEMMWGHVTKNLDKLEDAGVALTSDIVEREFKKVHVSLSSMVKKQADEKAAKAITNRKIAATEHAQKKVKAGFSSSKEADEAKKMLAEGDLRGFFGNIGKYGKHFK